MTLSYRERKRVEVMRRGENRVARKEEQAKSDGFWSYHDPNHHHGSPYYDTYHQAQAVAARLRKQGNVVRIIKDDKYRPNIPPNYKVFCKKPAMSTVELRRAYGR